MLLKLLSTLSGRVSSNNLPIVINWYFSSPVVISTLTITYGTSNSYYYPQNFVLYGSNYSSSDTNRFATSNMTQLFSESNILTNYTNSSVYNQSSTGTTSDPALGGTQNTIQTKYSNGGFNSTAYSTYSLLINSCFTNGSSGITIVHNYN